MDFCWTVDVEEWRDRRRGTKCRRQTVDDDMPVHDVNDAFNRHCRNTITTAQPVIGSDTIFLENYT